MKPKFEYPGSFRCKQDGRVVTGQLSFSETHVFVECESTHRSTRVLLASFEKRYEPLER